MFKEKENRIGWDIIKENLKQGNMIYKEIKKKCEYPEKSYAFETFIGVIALIWAAILVFAVFWVAVHIGSYFTK